MLTKDSIQMFLKKILPKVLKATVKGLLWFFLLYFLPMFLLTLLPPELTMKLLPGYSTLLSMFAIVTVFVVVLSELLAGTIFQYAFNIGKALVFMALFISALNGGFLEFDLEIVHIEADLRVYLAMLLTINFIGLAKTLLQAIDFQAKKTERQLAI